MSDAEKNELIVLEVLQRAARAIRRGERLALVPASSDWEAKFEARMLELKAGKPQAAAKAEVLAQLDRFVKDGLAVIAEGVARAERGFEAGSSTCHSGSQGTPAGSIASPPAGPSPGTPQGTA